MRGWSRGGGGRVSRCAGLWGHGDAGGGQTEHPGGGLEGEGGESAVVQDYGDTAMQEVGKQSIQGVGR